MRFEVSYDNIAGHGLIVRLPLGFGISFWPPWWGRWTLGIEIGSDTIIEWHLGPLAGEIWREDLAMLKMTSSEYEMKTYRESELYLAQHKAEKAVFQMARNICAALTAGHRGYESLSGYDRDDIDELRDALAKLDAIDTELDALDRE